MRNSLTRLLFLLLASIALASCGGGGGGGDENNDPDPEPTPDPMPDPTPTDQRLTTFTGSRAINEGGLRTTRFATADINSGRLRSRTTVNVGGFGEEFSASAFLYAQFTARANSAALLADIDWFATILSGVNLSTKSEVQVNLSVREVNSNGSLGTTVFSRQLERDGIGSGLKAVEVLNVRDNINQAFQLSLTEGQRYRVVVELECSLRVEILSLAIVDCNAESNDRGVNVNELMVMY